MSSPTGVLRYAGDWNVSTEYSYGMFVVASDSQSYGLGVPTNIGTDPTIQPSAVWFLLPSPGGAGVASLQNLTGALSLQSPNGSITINPSGSTIDLQTVSAVGSSITAGGATVACDNPAASGSITLTTSTGTNGDVNIDTTSSSVGDIELITNGNIKLTTLGSIQSITLENPTVGSSLTIGTQSVDITSPSGSGFLKIGGPVSSTGLYVSNSQLLFNNVPVATLTPFSYNFYVSSVSGSDTTGNGTITNPWQTIGQALDAASTIPDTNQISIILAAGTYTEAVSFNRANTFISGSATSNSTATIINGAMTIDLTASTLPFVIGGISSVQLLNVVYTNNVAKNQSFLITDCLIAPGAGVYALDMTDTSVGGTGDVTIQSCIIYQSDVLAVFNSGVFMIFVNTDIKNNPALTPSPFSMIQTKGTGRVNMYGCLITQNSSLSTVNPLIDLANDVATTGPFTFYNCSLVYTSATSDAGTGQKCCIRCSNTANISGITVFNNLMLCEGATTTNGIPGQFVVLQRTGAGTVSVSYGQNSGGATANDFPVNGGGFTKTPFVAVT